MYDDTQLLAFIAQYLPDNQDELITPVSLRYVLAQLVAAKVNTEVLATFAQLASPRFTGTPRVPTAPAGTNSDQVASTAFVQATLFGIASGKNLSELVLPQDVQAGYWYLNGNGIWEARRAFSAAADPVNGPNWRQVAGFGGQMSTLPVANLSDATVAGRAMLTAPSAGAQRGLVNNPQIPAGQYGDHPSFNSEDGPAGSWAWVIKSILTLLGAKVVQRPEAPTDGAVDDTADTFSGKLVVGFTAVADYEVFGAPGFPGTVNASAAGADVQNGRMYSRGLTGNLLAGGAGIRVAASGNRPAGAWLLSDKPFTGVAVVTPPTPTGDTTKPDVFFTAPASGAILAPNTQLLLTVIANDNVGVQSLTFTNGATGAAIGAGAKNGNTYTFPYTTGAAGPLSLVGTATDAAGNSQSATVNVTVQAATTTSPPTTPDAPFPSYDPVTLVLTFSHALGTSELEYNRLGGSFSTYAPIQVDDAPHNGGEWKARVKAYVAGNRLASGTADSPAITAKSVANTIPTADAGSDTYITLPTNQVLLLGKGYDPDPADKDKLTFVWTQITGPNTAALASPTAQNTTASNLVAGIYLFRLTVTDTQGASSVDDVYVTANASAPVGAAWPPLRRTLPSRAFRF